MITQCGVRFIRVLFVEFCPARLIVVTHLSLYSFYHFFFLSPFIGALNTVAAFRCTLRSTKKNGFRNFRFGRLLDKFHYFAASASRI